MIGLPAGFTAEQHEGDHDTIIHCSSCHMRWLHPQVDKCSRKYREALQQHKQHCEGLAHKQLQARTRGHHIDSLRNQ